MIVIALSSGTSVDAIDVAAVEFVTEPGTGTTDAPRLVGSVLLHREVAFSTSLRAAVLDALPPSPTTLEQVCRIDTRLGQEFAEAARAAVSEMSAAEQAVDLVVSHGQTLYHWVEDGSTRGTLQLGQPAWIAEATGLPVVSDVRVADVAAGGHGAPLAGTLDAMLLHDHPGPAAALNLGGIGNVTVVGAPGTPVAFDTGPANALLDAAVRRITSQEEHVDRDGALAASGTIDPALLARLLDHPHYRRDPPKSTGKEEFHAGYLDQVLAAHTAATGAQPSGPDLLATLVEVTATTVADALAPYDVGRVLTSGGGTHNASLMARLASRLAPARVVTSEDLGLDPDAKEAVLFALLGFLTWHGLPGSLPTCTGARHCSVSGRVTPGTRPLRLPEPLSMAPRSLSIHPPTHLSSDRRP